MSHECRKPVIAILCCGLFIYALWWLYDLGKVNAVPELAALRDSHALLASTNATLTDEIKALHGRLVILEKSTEIDRQAAEAVKNDLGGLEEELQAAREEVQFYRGIVSPGDVQAGLHIHRFSLQAGAIPGSYQYDLVLTQLKQNNRPVSGVVDWKVSGFMLDEPEELLLKGITRPAVKRLKFRFRYFQALSGLINLPEGFQATNVTVTITPAGNKKQGSVEQTFDWPETSEQ